MSANPFVLVHLGGTWFPYIEVALHQIRLFNPSREVVLITDSEAPLGLLSELNITQVQPSSLPASRQHREFSRRSKMDRSFRGGFWHFAIERFFYLFDYMTAAGRDSLIHVESDNMVYFNLDDLESAFRATTSGLSVTMDSDQRCIPSVVWIGSAERLCEFLEFYNARMAKSAINDMDSLGAFCRTQPYYLPVVPIWYLRERGFKLESLSGGQASVPLKYALAESVFEGVFDAAAYGQYLGGVDQRNIEKFSSQTRFVNESAVYQASDFNFLWEQDSEGRSFPVLAHGNQHARIFNLHIHSKRLDDFGSKGVSLPEVCD